MEHQYNMMQKEHKDTVYKFIDWMNDPYEDKPEINNVLLVGTAKILITVFEKYYKLE